MDLSKLDIASSSDEGTRMEIYHPTTEQSFEPNIYVWVVGMDSPLWRKHSMALQNKRMKKMMQRGRIRLTQSAEEIEADNIEMLAHCTVKWENVEWEGKPLPGSFDNFKMVYTKLPWFREQVQMFVDDRANFLSD
jgi:hypothetical protein